MKKILVALQTFGEYGEEPKKMLEESGYEIIYNNLGHRLVKDEIIDLGKDCSGVIAGVEPYNKEVLDKLSSLECISRAGVGTDNIDKGAAGERGVSVLNTPDVVIEPVAEMTVAMIFDLCRKLTYHTSIIRDGRWNEKKPGSLLPGKTVGVIGLGRIGKRVGALLSPFGVRIIAYDLFKDEKWAEENNVEYVQLNRLLSESDIITIHVAYDKERPFIIGRDEFERMKDGVLIVNTSRGEAIDEEALAEYLKSGKVEGAAMDVFRKEPYTGELCRFENVVLTPHISTLTRESRNSMEIESVKNLLDYLEKNK
ncbi:MAG: phosphoglycerate dehydrogenase [Methanomicrobiaceae archaeon]|nr:phosphoglycerate dehydrogenase [Methanomicrobiaceae archaeon]